MIYIVWLQIDSMGYDRINETLQTFVIEIKNHIFSNY